MEEGRKGEERSKDERKGEKGKKEGKGEGEKRGENEVNTRIKEQWKWVIKITVEGELRRTEKKRTVDRKSKERTRERKK